MAASTTRGRSFTDFPRNTKVRHVKACAEAARAEARVKAEMEACYEQWQPTQVHNAEAMEDAQLTFWCGVDLTIPRGQLKRDWELDMIEWDRYLAAMRLVSDDV